MARCPIRAVLFGSFLDDGRRRPCLVFHAVKTRSPRSRTLRAALTSASWASPQAVHTNAPLVRLFGSFSPHWLQVVEVFVSQHPNLSVWTDSPWFSTRTDILSSSIGVLTEELAWPGSRRKAKLNEGLARARIGGLHHAVHRRAVRDGTWVVAVNPQNTSIQCSSCGHKDKESRQAEKFECTQCGFAIHADENAGRNVEHAQRMS